MPTRYRAYIHGWYTPVLMGVYHHWRAYVSINNFTFISTMDDI
ncbi:hypothetical protein YPPY66_3521 [Yersinia pestis PY-66]|nr:hypothetical protein YPPY01_3169 [Yersinia pestis PY-01]EIQ87734.1 hypothetical protein YPPY02_3208 [Yersinia pestis PY-02]EIR00099.1 hypothetical protein YPPY04_3227 [Yersinia pestis PY-04]EIR01248.1 hypothetical protein YPPY05_3206 [Yersinia pestis PY-05]EIR04599.1 hypothetical protein YPPY06_3258 [Yersinia pestis PY-06]EIR15219.1 hypothetical protein YPPY07_3148 [Yersinia pestis PY-07]EIR18250.1 hypothetical protein YPPY09_3271 [Yersinia pestis PY-09]EIR32031.1 hypothetical protein YPP